MKHALFLFTVQLSLFSTAQPGVLDPTFGTNGRATVGVTGTYSSAEAIAEQADGKLVVAGSTPGFALLARFNSNGSIDDSFGTNGLVLTDVDESNDFFSTVAIQPDGKILAGGVRFNNLSDGRAIVARYAPNGALDNSFGTNGIVTINIPGSLDSYVRGIAQQPDGKVLVLGERYTSTGFKTFLLRLLTNGVQEGWFGVVPLEAVPGADHYAGDLVLQPDGQILVCGSVESPTTGGAFAMRVDTDGLIDDTFGSGGCAFLNLGGNDQDIVRSVRLQPDGKILLGGLIVVGGDYGVLVTRLLPNGALDNTFGTGGYVNLALSVDDWAAPSLDLQPDGKIVVGVENSDTSNPRVHVFRLTTNGAPDTGFGTNGVGVSNATTGNNGEYAWRARLLSDGGIAVCGYVDSPSNLQVAVWKFQSGLNMGVVESPGAATMSISPNPVVDHFLVTSDDELDASAPFIARDATGRETSLAVKRQGSALVAEASMLSKGQYSITVRTASGLRTARFIKQ